MITVATWNTEWREPGSRDAGVIVQRLRERSPDIVCLTEAHAGVLDDWGGYVVEGTTNWGGPAHGTRRKVLLWSRTPWTDVDVTGSAMLPPGMFCRASTMTSAGPITVVGIVIPYHMANVRSGRLDRSMWEDHRRFLEAMPTIVRSLPSTSILLGDFNQRMPSSWVPRRYQEMLADALAPLSVATGDLIDPDGKRLVDHIAYGSAYYASGAGVIANIDERGRAISDHCGVVVELALTDRAA